MSQLLKPWICSQQNNPELFQYLCQKLNPQSLLPFIKSFKIEPITNTHIEDLNENRSKSSS